MDLSGKPLPPHLRLRTQSVGQRTLDQYHRHIAEFEKWAASKHRKITSNTLDRLVTLYLTHLMEDLDLEVHHGTYLVFGLQLLRCNSSKSEFLVESKAALAGWRKARPSNMRLPAPEDFVFDFCHLAISEGKLDLAFMMALQINTYLRPSEVLSLTVDHIGKPHGRRYSSWTVIVAPSELDVRTKTGPKDDAVIVGDLACQSWVLGWRGASPVHETCGLQVVPLDFVPI